MVRETIAEATSQIYEYFRLKSFPTNNQIDKWHGKVKFIPDIAMPWIVDQITNQDNIPRNLPKEIKKQWYAWRKAHPDQSASDFEYCQDCHGHGIHLFKKLDRSYDPPIVVSYVAPCAMCNNWKKHFGTVINGGRLMIEGKRIGEYCPPVPRVTKQQLIDDGFDYLSQSNPKEKKIVPQKVTDLTSGIGGV